jgi:hypothetical protein
VTDLITRARRAAGIAGNDVTGNLLIELVEEIERLRTKPANLSWTVKSTLLDRVDRLDRIEKWLRSTHGYPYPGKD